MKIIQVDMKLEIQRVNQKINKIEELMTNFLEQISTNNLQVTQVQQSLPQVRDTGVDFLFKTLLSFSRFQPLFVKNSTTF